MSIAACEVHTAMHNNSYPFLLYREIERNKRKEEMLTKQKQKTKKGNIMKLLYI